MPAEKVVSVNVITTHDGLPLENAPGIKSNIFRVLDEAVCELLEALRLVFTDRGMAMTAELTQAQ